MQGFSHTCCTRDLEVIRLERCRQHGAYRFVIVHG